MSPVIASRHLPDRADRDAVVGGNGLVLFSGLAPKPDRGNFGLVKFGVAITRSFCAWAVISGLFASCRAAFRVPVAHVLGVSANPQMARANAGRNVACVTDAHVSRRDAAVSQFPRNAMGQSRRAAVVSDAAVSVALFGASPQPAIAGRVNASPEPCGGVHVIILPAAVA